MTSSRTNAADWGVAMPGNPPSVNTEREALVAYLVQQRDGLKYAAHGLTEEQARARPTVSALSVAGLIKHAATTADHDRQRRLRQSAGVPGQLHLDRRG